MNLYTYRKQLDTLLENLKRTAASIQRPSGQVITQMHFDRFYPKLTQKIQVIIYGTHSQDWMGALDPQARLWSTLGLVGKVSQIDANSEELSFCLDRNYYPIAISLMEAHTRLLPPTITSLTPSRESLEILENKVLFAHYLIEYQLAQYAPTLYTSLTEARFPCVVKPSNLNSGREIEVAFSQSELRVIAERKERSNESFLIQEYIAGFQEYVTHAVLKQGQIVWHQTFSYELVNEHTIRTGDMTANLSMQRVPTSSAFLKVLTQIAAGLNLSGPVNADYKIIEGVPFLFELNPRLGGSLMRAENHDLLAQALNKIIHGAANSEQFFLNVIAQSPYFDDFFYSQTPHEFDEVPINNPAHYFFQGAYEERDPSAHFSTFDYQQLHLTHEAHLINPLVHYELEGRAHGLPIVKAARRDLMKKIGDINKKPINSSLGLWVRKAQKHLLSASMPFSTYTISSSQGQKLIDRLDLQTVKNAWHYSWDVERFFSQMILVESKNHLYLFSKQPITYRSAPAPLFSSDTTLTHITAHQGRFFPFWLLQFQSVESFLKRRSQISSNPSRNFPSLQTYDRILNKKGGLIERYALHQNRSLFIEQFSKWKSPKFNFDGTQCIEYYESVNSGVPASWYYFYLLRDRHSGQGQGVMLTIEDGQSAAMLNLANQPGFGVIMLTQSLELMEKLGYSSFNAGVSGHYGHYKNLIFLDALPTDATGYPPPGIA